LDETADHFLAVEPAIVALTRSAPERAFDLANSLNTAPRRDQARVKIIEALVGGDVEKIDPIYLDKVFMAMHYVFNRDRALLALLKGLVAAKEKTEHLVPFLVQICDRSRAMKSPEERCGLLLQLYSVCAVHPIKLTPSFLEQVREEIKVSWTQIEPGDQQVDMGFRIIAEMAQPAPDFARIFLDELNNLRRDVVLDCHDSAQSYTTCCRLAFRAFSGIIEKRLFGSPELQDLADLIDNIPSPGVRAVAWSEIALRLFLGGDEASCKEIALKRVKGAISKISPADEEQRANSIVHAAPALFCAHAGTAEEMIDALEPEDKDQAYRQICEFLIAKELPFDPYDGNAGGREPLSVETIWEVCRILGKIEGDHTVYVFFEKLVDNLELKRNRNTYNREQWADLISRLKELISKFPSKNFIQHEGYKILAEGHLARLEKSGPAVWDALILRAKALPNHSDQAFVFSELARAVPSKFSPRKRQLFEDAKKKIATLSSHLDRLIRYEALAKGALEFDPTISRNALQKAIEDSMETEFRDIGAIRKRLVDMAYRINPEFASTLASGLDDDPVRKAKKEEIRMRLDTLKLRDSLQKGDDKVVTKKADNPKMLSEAAWMALRNLNSGKVNAIHSENTRGYVQRASALGLPDAYWMLSLVVENAVRHYKGTNEASTYLNLCLRRALWQRM
jgi:uncharacterized membrane protein